MQSGRAVFYFLLLIVLSASTLAEDGHLTDTANENSIESKDHQKESDDHSAGGVHVFIADFSRVQIPFIIGMWIFCASIAKIGFHMLPKLHHIFPESCLLIVIGVIIGLVLFYTHNSDFSPLTPTTFFFYMLPPIILDAGYFMPNRLFFDHLGTILWFAVVGTLWNTATIGLSLWGCGLTGIYGFDLPLLDTLLFAALISAVDPVAVLAVFEEIQVNEILYIVVFGESLLNDAVTVVLYNMFDAYVGMGAENIKYTDILSGFASFAVVAIGGTIIGIIWGFITGFVTRFTNHVRVIEPLFIFIMSYLSYLNAEIFHMSGILAITFCGITMKNYVESNISDKSRTTIKYAMKMLSSSSETIIFICLGVNTVSNDHEWNTAFVLLTILFCSVFRTIGTFALAEFANRFRLHKLDRVDEFVMSYGGLRGAVAFALVLLIDPLKVKKKCMFLTTTICVIYFTVFIQGITIKPLVQFLKVKKANKYEKSMHERVQEKIVDYLMCGVDDIVGEISQRKFRDKFKQLNNKYIRPCLIRDQVHGHEPKILETYAKLTMKDAMDQMRRKSESKTIINSESESPNMQGAPQEPVEIRNKDPFRTHMEHKVDFSQDLPEDLLWKPAKQALGGLILPYSRHTVDDCKLSSPDLSKPQISSSPSLPMNANAFTVTNAAQTWKKNRKFSGGRTNIPVGGQLQNDNSQVSVMVIHEENTKDDDDDYL